MTKLAKCPKCGKDLICEYDNQVAIWCDNCDKSFQITSKESIQRLEKSISVAKESRDWTGVPTDVIEKESKNIILTTTLMIPNAEIETVLEIITAECVYGMNIFRDLFAGVRDIVGGRSKATQNVLRDARKTCLTELRREALIIGADAVIGVDLDYSEISGGGKSGMLFLVASGTAVKLKGNSENIENEQ